MLAVEPTSAVWQVLQARSEADLATIALDRRDWAEAAQRFTAARATYEQLATRDPNNREHRRAAAIAAAQLADAETELRQFDAARTAWLAAIDHLAVLARSNNPEARLELAYGLRGHAEFERTHGRFAAAGPQIERAIAVSDGTPTDKDVPVMTYYRAAVIAEAAAEQDHRGQRRAALAGWQHAQTMLQGLAARMPLEPDWATALRQIEAELARRGVRAPPRGRR